jgi:uncharacterized membrane protein YqaE (UPF0057 family)
MKVPLIVLWLFFPFLAVPMKKEPWTQVLWAPLLRLLGSIGVIYGILQVTEN